MWLYFNMSKASKPAIQFKCEKCIKYTDRWHGGANKTCQKCTFWTTIKYISEAYIEVKFASLLIKIFILIYKVHEFDSLLNRHLLADIAKHNDNRWMDAPVLDHKHKRAEGGKKELSLAGTSSFASLHLH